MSEHGLFFNSLDRDREYDAESFSDWLKKFFTNGVFTGDLFVQADDGMNIKVGTGYCNINGKVMIYAEPTPLVVEPANGIYPRIDTVVLELNMTERDIFLKVVTGDYAGLTTPQPTPPVRTGAIYQLVLAQIYVGVGVTEITQADITDTRPITELCGIVTGTVTEMDFSQFAAQFATYYAQFKAGYESDMEAWKALQEQSFEAWEIAEKADFDEWFANLHYILDGDVAGHLQNEIDALAAGATGSIFRIHTTESSLIGKSVTLTGSTETETEVFDSNGNAEFKGITDIGVITFVATDGTDTARTQITIPYFGNYPINMAFWSATVNIHTDTADLYGATISVIKNNVLIDTTTFDNTGEAVYTATSTGTYRFRVTLSGQDYEVEQAVTEQTTYNLTLNAGLNLQAWIIAGSTTEYPLNPSSYADFAALEADEEAIRQLMLVHDAVDYLATAPAGDSLMQSVIGSDICAKWINNSDYALDTLGANSNIASEMDTADKYGYGEWGKIDSTTWGALGNVPIMTANNAPYGTAFASSEYSSSYTASNAFDGNDSTEWASTTAGAVNGVLGYIFNSPIIPKAVKIRDTRATNNIPTNVTVQGSNNTTTGLDGNWDDIKTYDRDSQETFDVVESNTAYKALRIKVNAISGTAGTHNVLITGLQFYGRELKPLVPTMTGNTTPKGECVSSGDSMQGSGNDFPRYYAFDNNSATYWLSDATSVPNTYIGYKFSQKNKICGIGFVEDATYNYDRMGTFKVEGSDTGDANDWHDISGTLTVATGSANKLNTYTFNGGAYKYVRAYAVTGSASYRNSIVSMQFYGMDYSEKEFGTGSTRKTIYDHGVAPSGAITASSIGTSSNSMTEESNQLLFSISGSSAQAVVLSPSVDMSDYDNVWVKVGSKATSSSANFGHLRLLANASNFTGQKGSYTFPNPLTDLNPSLDVSQINEGVYIAPCTDNAGSSVSHTLTMKELWLE